MNDLKKTLEQPAFRAGTLNRVPAVDGGLAISFSSEHPVDRGFYKEILSHKPGAIDLSRAKDGLPFLMDHDDKQVVGRTEAIAFTDKGRGTVRFGSGALAVQARRDIVEDGIRPDISFGYRILEYSEEKRADGLYITATRWQPFEVSSVGVPADITVGVNRAAAKKTPADDESKETEDESQEDQSEEAAESPLEEAAEEELEPETAKTKTKTKKKSTSAVAGRAQEIAMSEPTNTATADAAATQRKAQAELLFLASDYNVPAAQMREWAEKNFTPEQAKDDILKGVKAVTRAIPQPGAEDVSAHSLTNGAKEAQEYSHVRALRAALAMAEGKTPEKSYEVEVSNEIAKRLPASYKQRGAGFFSPMRNMPQTRALDSITSTKGVELKFTQYGGEVIEILRQKSVVASLGMRILSGLTSPVAFPRQTGGATATWVSENPGADVAASNPTFGTITLNPKTLMSRTAYSRQLLNLDVIDTESFVRNELAVVTALAVDKAAIYGIGSAGQPQGIYLAPSVGVKAMAGVPTFGKLVDMVTGVAVANASVLGVGAFITTPGMAGVLMQTLKSAVAGATYIWTGSQLEGNVAGYKAVGSNQMSAVMTGSTETGGAEHGIIYGVWEQLMMGTWGVTETVVDPYTIKNQGMIEVTTFQMADIILRHGEAFTKSTGATLV